jgi:hypothetical protein
MIKVTYEHICDGCKALLNTEAYECSNAPGYAIPQPHRKFSFHWTGVSAEFCGKCAEPMYIALNEAVDKIIKARSQS